MLIFFAWFAQHNKLGMAERQAMMQRLRKYEDELIPATYSRHQILGQGWGIHLAHAELNGWKWPLFHESGDTATVSVGFPTGAAKGATPQTMGEQLLAGQDIHEDLLPPFAMLALNRRTQRFTLQQDWLGQARVFEYAADGVTAFSSRPTMLPAVLGEPVRPNLNGWSYYLASSHFGGDSSPVAGARLLSPGERVTGIQRPEGHWSLERQQRRNLDDFLREVAPGSRGHGQNVIEEAAEGFLRTAESVAALRDGQISLDLSGGRDSRVIAATLIAAGLEPALYTRIDIPAEGEIAGTLTDIIAETRGLRLDHKFSKAAEAANVHRENLRTRVDRLQNFYDYQFSSIYLNRPAWSARLPVMFSGVLFSGAGGEIATGYWYPKDTGQIPDHAEMAAKITSWLSKGVGLEFQHADVQERQRELCARIAERAAAAGVTGYHMLDYAYITERARRWYGSAYGQNMVTPFLCKEVVQASFAMSVEDHRQRRIHTGLVKRLMPEWAEVPYVTGSSSTSTVPQMWDGDDLPAIAALLKSADGPLAGLMELDAVGRVVKRCSEGHGKAPHNAVLRQFSILAVADQTLPRPGVTGLPDQRTARRLKWWSRAKVSSTT